MTGCNSTTQKKTVGTPALSQDETISTENTIHLNSNISQKIYWNDKLISLWVDQFIFIKGGDANGKVVNQLNEDKTQEILHYYKNNKINKLNLTNLVLKYNLYQGIQRITTSPSGKYLALEFGSDETNKTLLIDTDSNEVKMLWYYEKADNSMQSVTWNNNDDSQFLFFPSASLGDIYLYNIENNSMKKLYAIDNTEFTPSNSIIKYEQNHITVIDTNTSKTYSFDSKISKDDELTIRDYFPNKTMTKKFSGGFENSGYTNTIYKIEGDKVQINKTNTGGAFVSIYQISNDDIRLIFTSEVPDEELQKDYIKTFKPERDDDGRVILKSPLKVGTH